MHNLDTLYISDLDGTLLTPECKVSDETASALNTMIANGLFFTVATARSASSAAPLLEKLNLRLPVILMNEWSSHLRYGKTGACFRMPD